MRTRAIAATAGVAGVAALIALSTAFPAAAGNKPNVSTKNVLPILTAPQSQQDRLPAGMHPSQLGNVSPNSVHYLGSNAVAKYWVGQAGPAKVCLIVQIPGGNHVSAATCSLLSDFYLRGLALRAGDQTDDPTSSAEAYLLPNDIDPADVGATRYEATSLQGGAAKANLITVRPHTTSGWTAKDIRRDNGITFHFTPLSTAGR